MESRHVLIKVVIVMLVLSVDLVLIFEVVRALVLVLVDQVSIQDWHSIYCYQLLD